MIDRTKLPLDSGGAMVRVSAPDGAPNVLIVLIDDMGYGASSAFGGPCEMPTADRLAADGLRYSRFHVTALCSPTRQALLTGRNHHSVSMGSIVECATPAAGYSSVRPASAATLARTLLENSYNTAAFGKMHQTPSWEAGPMGPFDRWPTGEGFQKFYGFIGAEMNHWTPLLYDGTTQLAAVGSDDPDYHLSEDLADHAIAWVRGQQSLSPQAPFFVYLPFGATHSPHHVPPAWREKYRGRFDEGWDVARQRTFARQKELGLLPKDAVLPEWTPGVPHWDELSDDARKVAAAMMENYAGFAEHTDAQLGRLLDELDRTGALQNTIVYYILGDNGASAEGNLDGTFSEIRSANGIDDTAEDMAEWLADLGTDRSYPNYPTGWALAMNTPYRWCKQVASHYGGTRNGLVVSWPAGIDRGNGLRHQFHHVTDVVPTILEAAGIPAPASVAGVAQQPIEGTSMAYTFRDSEADERKKVQYFEMLGNRGIYADGWMAGAKHRTPWGSDPAADRAYEDDPWELHDITSDWTQARDLSVEQPDKLAEMQRLFETEAEKHNVFPLGDRMLQTLNPALAGRPEALGGRRGITLTPDVDRLPEEVAPNVKNRSFAVRARVTLTDEPAEGVLLAQGGFFGGWALYMVGGKVAFTYNFLGTEAKTAESTAPLGEGDHLIQAAFDYDGGGVGRGGSLTLSVDGQATATVRIERTIPYWYGPDDAFDVGRHCGTPVSPRYAHTSAFTGQLHSVHIELDTEDPSAAADEAGLFASRMGTQ